ncbi:MAG TPA: bifunctional methylenetetrahydrofolate dehydrogenase/methenyltetrahydrofolate cyclohydrolase FolD [Candidatus Desulfobacillus sp.]|nr:bifunctional methylenetetrahydrofolate dehydrogenase/methenyltetrahydrofolate cyclohydrolase FolD [Candidatus Desulfobacillus sp.]
MTARILDGNALSARLRESLRQRAAELSARGCKPGLAVILVGENPASQVYVRNKIKACEAVGLHSEKYAFPADVPPSEVLARIAALNADPAIHGILVQLPLPQQFDESAVLAAVAAEKDVDGFHAENVGLLAQGRPRFVSCTPLGVMKMLESEGVELAGREAVVVGRSNIVGKPMALLLVAASATVTVCHSRTRDLAAHVRRADVLVAAVGRPRMISGDMVKPGAVVIDVGINRLREGPDAGKLCGDVDFASVKEFASLITPVPGGVGPMTITMLLANTIDGAARAVAHATH